MTSVLKTTYKEEDGQQPWTQVCSQLQPGFQPSDPPRGMGASGLQPIVPICAVLPDVHMRAVGQLSPSPPQVHRSAVS